jgi:hypothetical protein
VREEATVATKLVLGLAVWFLFGDHIREYFSRVRD